MAGKVGLILGMLSAIHYDAAEPAIEVSIYEPGHHAPLGIGTSSECHYILMWGFHLPLPCYCEVCYRLLKSAAQEGALRRIRTEEFHRYKFPNPQNLIKTLVTSRINNAIVALLPEWHALLGTDEET